MSDAILEAGAVFPVNKAKIPALGKGVSWKDYTDPSYDYKAWGFAVKTGDVSGITVVDFDNKDVVPPGRNVSTLRGSHVWVPSLTTDRNKIDSKSKVDLRANGGYAVFASPNHQVLSTSLNSREEYQEYLSTTTVSKVSNEEVKDNGVHFEPVETNWYLKELEAHGYAVDVEWVSKRLASQVKGTAEGARNQWLYLNLAQVINLGGSEEQVMRVVEAGYEAGLDPAEVMKTYGSAMKARRLTPMFHVANKWADRARVAMKSSPVIDELVRLATEQHNSMPLVSKKGMEQEAGIPLSTIKRHLKKLEELGLAKEQVNPGFYIENGLKKNHPSNYKLTFWVE